MHIQRTWYSCIRPFLLLVFLSLFLPVAGLYSQSAVINPPTSISREKAELFCEFLSPVPDAEYVHRESSIIIRQGEKINTASIDKFLIELSGSKSGQHAGDLILAKDQKTLIFTPFSPFQPSETVTVTILNGSATSSGVFVPAISYTFRVSDNQVDHVFNSSEYEESEPENSGNGSAGELDEYTLPFDVPEFGVTETNHPAEGLMLILRKSTTFNSHDYMVGVNNHGEAEFYYKVVKGAANLDYQPSGLLSWYDPLHLRYMLMDTTFTLVDSFACVDGYDADMHDFQHLPNGHAFLIAYDPQEVDMSQVVPGGREEALVIGLIIQELDEDHNLVFQWRSWDFFEITDASDWINLRAATVDYVHGNAISIDEDGAILLSSRHMDEITKIDGSTGDLLWRMGGNNNDFTFHNDMYAFSCQHDIRRLPNGNLTLFDNGNYHDPPFTRVIEYQVDEISHEASIVWEYVNPLGYTSPSMGSIQRLENGNTLIGWGSRNDMESIPEWVEITPNGATAFEMWFEDDNTPYRIRRHTWNGVAARPSIVALPDENGDIALSFGFFGHEDVAMYYIYEGNSPHPDIILDSTTLTSMTTRGVDLLPGAHKYYTVSARLTNGLYSEMSYVEEYTHPSLFTLNHPRDNETIVDDVVTLRWYRNPAYPAHIAINYHLEYSTDPDFSEFSYIITQDTSFVLEELDELPDDITIYWRVYFIDIFNNEIWTIPGRNGWSFSIAIPESPAEFHLRTPEDGSSLGTLEATFTWTRSSDPDPDSDLQYQLELARDSSFSDTNLIDLYTTQSNSHVVSNLSCNTEYWWRVLATDNNTDGTYSSETFRFGTDVSEPPSAFILSTPQDHDTLTLNSSAEIEFVWFQSIDPNLGQIPTYQLFVLATMEAQDSLLTISDIPDTMIAIPLLDSLGLEDLKTPRVITWWVQAISCGDTVRCESEFTFLLVQNTDVSFNDDPSVPSEFALSPFYPNPFNAACHAQIALPVSEMLQVNVYDILGRQVAILASGQYPAGYHKLEFHNNQLSSGIYFVQIQAGTAINVVRKVVLLR